MQRKDDVWGALREVLEAGEVACLVTMVDAEGNGPNRPGARMMVASDGRHVGTVGGGSSEAALVEKARAALSQSPPSPPALVGLSHTGGTAGDVLTPDDSGVTRTRSGMICSGSQVFATCCLAPSDLPAVRGVVDAVREGRPLRVILDRDGLHCSETDASSSSRISFDPTAWRYTEVVGLRDTVTLVGGGHVSLALSPLLASLGMHVVVLDNRSHLPTMQNNPHAHEHRVIDYADVADHVPDGDHSFVAIMTFGHRHDEQVLEQLVGRPLRYLGMMGSKPKVGQIRERLLARGIPRETLDAVHAPIGLPIGSNTPAEIAISIAAEIVAVRRGQASNAGRRD